MNLKFLAIDTETTGVDPETDRIVEIFAMEVRYPGLQVVDSFGLRCNPGIPIPAEATRVHGIRDEDVADYAPFSATASMWQQKLQGACLIAFNGRRFDVPLLHNELVRCGQVGLRANQPVIDPYELFLEDSPRNLTSAMQHYLGRGHPKAHTALGDVRAMLSVLRRQLKTRDPVQLLQREAAVMRLDFSGRFIVDESFVICFNFGKYKGQPAKDHLHYLAWMLKSDFPKDVKKVAADVLNGCSDPRHERDIDGRPPRPGGPS